ncbi:MAG: DUF4340 domain-containing protein [Eubacteriales bacterium]|nr:DUF4340 domain-containing protein [Eubacteriales bacterium]
MKKQKIQLLVLLIVCLACVGGYFFIRSQSFETEEETTEVSVTDFNKDDVTELIVSGDHELHFVLEDGTWTESSLPGESISQESVNLLVSEIDNITTTETVVENPEDLSQYGLAEPFRTIQAVLSDGTTVTIHAGSESTLLSKYYVQVEGDENVYLVSSYIVTDFDKTAEEFVEEEETESSEESAEVEETESSEESAG